MDGGISLKSQLVLPRLKGLDAGQAMTALRKASPEIEKVVEARIRERTPERTGALKEDVTGKPYTDEVGGSRQVNLVTWYATDDNQLSEWGRVYAPYQEGPPLGLTTYTNEPHQMFARIETDDLPVIQAWADATVQAWAENMAAEANAGAVTYEFGE